MESMKGKRLLILSGTGPHVKVVRKAREMGVYTIVADYLEPSKAAPAKLISDENWNISLLDVESLIRKAKESDIDGVVAAWSDISQMPYAEICEALGLPCYGTPEQFRIMSDKGRFKELCRRNGIGVIPEYTEEDAKAHRISFPVVTKPVDSRASKGVSVCRNERELEAGIACARSNSLSGNILIEKYIGGKNSFQVNYLFADGKAYVLRTTDGYKGLVEEKLDRVALCSVSPSVYTEEYMAQVNDRFVEMMRSIGFRNGPVMAQGFYDDGVFRFYDPGLRFPAVDYEAIYRSLYGADLAEIMITFALTGKMPELKLSDRNVYLDGKSACILYPTLGAGTVSEVKGIDEVARDPAVYAMECRYEAGDTVEWTYTTRQRFAEIVLLENSFDDMVRKIRQIQQMLSVRDENGRDMMYKPFDVGRLLQ